MMTSRNAAVLGWVLFFALLAAVAFLRFDPGAILFTDDAALSFGVARGILAGEYPLAGPPASLAGRHLGPWPFYLDAFALGFGSEKGAIVVLTLVKTFAIAAVFLTLTSLYSFRTGLTPILLGVFLASGMWWWMIRVPWHSTGLLLPAVLACLAAVEVFRNGRGSFPQLVFALSLLASWHLATLPLVAVLGAAGVLRSLPGFGGSAPVRPKASRSIHMLMIAGALLIWAPTLAYEGRFPGHGALSALFTKSTRYRDPIGVEGAVLSIGDFTRRYTVGDPGNTGTFAVVEPVAVPIAGAVLVSLMLFVICRGAVTGRWIAGTALATYLVYGFFLARLPTTNPHLLDSTLPLLLLTLGVLFGEVEERIPGRPLLLAVPLFFLLLAGAGAVRSLRNIDTDLFVPYATLLHQEEVAQVITLDSAGAEFIVITRGAVNRRENGIYYFSGPRFLPQLSGRKRLRELPSFQRQNNRAEHLYVLDCENRFDPSPIREWRFERRVELSSCTTCGLCTMGRFSRGGNP